MAPRDFRHYNDQARSARRDYKVVPFMAEMAADLLTPVSAFMRLVQPGEKAFLLESVEGGERLARYSFLGVNPERSFFIRAGKLYEQVHRHKNPAKRAPQVIADGRHERLLEKLGARIGPYTVAEVRRAPGLPAFAGGAVGYIGYDCAGRLEPRVEREWREPEKFPYDAYLMVFRNIVAFDHVRHRVLLIANVFPEEESLARGSVRAKREIKALQARLATAAPGEKSELLPDVRPDARPVARDEPALHLRPSLGKPRFCAAVKAVQREIRQGEIFQCVLSEQFSLTLQSDPFSVYRALRALSPSPYLFYLATGDRGKEVLLGASPEMLARVTGRKIETCPIAGTRPRGSDLATDQAHERNLMASVKERAEHLMLVDLGRNDIGRVALPGSVKVNGFMSVERFSHVMHLVSNVEGQLRKGKTPWDGFLSCFPAGTLTGAPKIRAMQIISEHESASRGPYGGAVVYQDFSGSLDSCITIRSLFANGKRAFIQAGAGVVADSNPAREYAEILHKTKAIRGAVALAEARARSRGGS